jgi:hypothetical protein
MTNDRGNLDMSDLPKQFCPRCRHWAHTDDMCPDCNDGCPSSEILIDGDTTGKITFRSDGEHEEVLRIEQGSTVWFKKGVTIHYKGKQQFEFLEDVTMETPND